MTIDLKALGEQVRNDLETYEIPPRHPDMLGSALPFNWYEKHLDEMRKGLVEPYWADVIDYDQVMQTPLIRKVVIVARDGHENYLAFDPRPTPTAFDNDFAMVGTEKDGLHLYNVRGDAVGCFLSF